MTEFTTVQVPAIEAVIVKSEDWTVIQEVVRAVIANPLTDKALVEQLSAMKVNALQFDTALDIEVEEPVEEEPKSISTPDEFAAALTEKFKDEGQYALKDFFVASKGSKFAKIAQRTSEGHSTSVHCFVNRDGWVFKAAGWTAPAKGVRFNSMDEALAAADVHGSYLYKK